MRSELAAFWRATSEEDMAQDTVIYTDESFTPDLYVMPCFWYCPQAELWSCISYE